MAQTYLQIQKQIEKLQRQAEILRASEVSGVVDRIKVAIAHYGLTAEQLGLSGSDKAAPKAKGKTRPALTTAKFSDGKGNVWSGRGPRPHWLRDALNAGRRLEEFKAGAQPQGAPVATASAPTSATKGASKSKGAFGTIRYRDDAGHAWSGRGPKPGWLKAALDTGKSLEDFAAK